LPSVNIEQTAIDNLARIIIFLGLYLNDIVLISIWVFAFKVPEKNLIGDLIDVILLFNGELMIMTDE